MPAEHNVARELNSSDYKINLPQFRSINAVLRQHFAGSPQRLAFTFNSGDGTPESYSYEQFEHSVLTLAAELTARKLAGSRALLLFNPGYDYVVAFFGCLFAGVIAVPAYPPLTNRDWPRLLNIVDDCSAATILTASFLKSAIYDWVSVNRKQKMECIAVDQIGEQTCDIDLPQQIGHDSIAFLQYTSGSTGNPKGVMVTHGNLLHNCAAILEAMGADTSTVGASWLPPYHDMGLIGGIISPLLGRFPVHLMSPMTFLKNPLVWLKTISRERVTVSAGPNFAYDYCVRRISSKDAAALDLSSWKVAANGAEPIKPTSLREFARHFAGTGFSLKTFLPCYGMAEGTLMVSGTPVHCEPRIFNADADAITQNFYRAPSEDGKQVEIVSGGFCVRDTKVFIVNRTTMCEAGPDEIGEIWVQGPGVAVGYWQRPEASDEAFNAYFESASGGIVGPCMRTGDLGFIHEQEVVITGRAKEIIIIRGRNYYPQDIEWIAQQQNAALRSGSGAAFSVDTDDGEALVLVQEIGRAAKKLVEDADAFNALVQSINQALGEQIGVSLHALCLIEQGSQLKTSSGKIQRVGSRTAWLDGSLSVVRQWQRAAPLASHKTPVTASSAHIDFMHADYALTQLLVDWVAQALGVPASAIDIDAPFSALGLDSVQGVEIAARLEQYLEKPLPSTLLFRYPTINDLVAFINNANHKIATTEDLAEFDDLDALSREDLLDRLKAELQE